MDLSSSGAESRCAVMQTRQAPDEEGTCSCCSAMLLLPLCAAAWKPCRRKPRSSSWHVRLCSNNANFNARARAPPLCVCVARQVQLCTASAQTGCLLTGCVVCGRSHRSSTMGRDKVTRATCKTAHLHVSCLRWCQHSDCARFHCADGLRASVCHHKLSKVPLGAV